MATCNSLLILLSLQLTICLFSLSHSQPPTALHIYVKKNETTSQYYALFQVGNSILNTVIDLGGQYLWFDCGPPYIPISYKPIPCGSKTCGAAKGSGCVGCNSAPRPGCTNNTCGIFAYNPFQNLLSSQGLGKDTVSITGTDGRAAFVMYDSPNFLLSCAPDSSMLQGLAAGLQGIVGLANTATSLQTQLFSTFNLSRKFALCLPSSSKEGEGSGDIFIGGGPYYMFPYPEDLSKSLTKTPLIVNPVSTAPIYSQGDKSDEYFIDVRSIKVDGEVVSFSPSLLSIDKNGVGGTKLSTVTPYTMLHASIYKPLIKHFVKAAASRKIKRAKSTPPFGACFKAKSIAHTNKYGPVVPEIDLVLPGRNAVWKISGANSMVEAKKNVLCLGFIDGGAEPRTSIVLGGKQLENYLLEFDLASSKLGFSTSLLLLNTNCSHDRVF